MSYAVEIMDLCGAPYILGTYSDYDQAYVNARIYLEREKGVDELRCTVEQAFDWKEYMAYRSNKLICDVFIRPEGV